MPKVSPTPLCDMSRAELVAEGASLYKQACESEARASEAEANARAWRAEVRAMRAEVLRLRPLAASVPRLRRRLSVASARLAGRPVRNSTRENIR